MSKSTSADLWQQHLASYYSVWCIICLQKGKHCGVFSGEGSNTCDKYLFPVSWLFCFGAAFKKKLNLVFGVFWDMSQNVMWKNWDSVVKVTVKVYIIKI